MPTCYDPLTNRTVTVSGPCPGTTIPMGPGITTPPPHGTETQAQATPGPQAAGITIPTPNINISNDIPGLSGIQTTLNNLQNSSLLKLWSDPTSWKRLGLLVAGFIALILGFALWAFGGRNREPTEVITQQ